MLKATSESLFRKVPKQPQILCCKLHEKSDKRICSYRTNESNPINHKIEQLGQFYTMSEDIKKKLFLNGGLPKSFEQQVKTFSETCFMIRDSSIDIINCLKNVDYNKPVVRFVMYGKKGNGKTLGLAHVIHYGLQSNYLIVHIPWVGNWMRWCKEASNSETREGFINTNLDAAAWLLHFKVQNAELLQDDKFKISKDYMWSKRESTLKGAHILELIDHGINRVKFASDTVVALAEQIKLFSKDGLCKTLVAIDGFNAFFFPQTRIYNEKKEMVHPSRVTVTEAFLNLTTPDWNNGAIVVTVDELAIAKNDNMSHLP